MDINSVEIDEAELALLYLTLRNQFCASKGHNWDEPDRFFQKGMIDNPVPMKAGNRACWDPADGGRVPRGESR